MEYPTMSSQINPALLSVVFGTCALVGRSGNVANGEMRATEGRVHAKGLVLLQSEISTVPCPRYITIKVTDNEWEVETEPSILTIRGSFIRSSQLNSGLCSLLAPAFAGPSDYHEIGFVFVQPGNYEVRWQFGSTGVTPVDVFVDQTVHVELPTEPDLRFLRRAGSPALLRKLFGQEFFEQQGEQARERMFGVDGEDIRALKVIARLLRATRADHCGGVIRSGQSLEDARVWANALGELAKTIPESSYAPYTAFYAGCVYSALVGHEEYQRMIKEGLEKSLSRTKQETEAISNRVQAHPDYIEGEGLLRAAVADGDTYLKPRAQYMLGMHRATALDWQGAEKMLAASLQSAPGDRTLEEMVKAKRAGFARAKSRQVTPAP